MFSEFLDAGRECNPDLNAFLIFSQSFSLARSAKNLVNLVRCSCVTNVVVMDCIIRTALRTLFHIFPKDGFVPDVLSTNLAMVSVFRMPLTHYGVSATLLMSSRQTTSRSH